MDSKMLDHVFNLKFSAKTLGRESAKCKKLEKNEIEKAKKALAKGEVEIARIHSENAIRQKIQSENFLRMGSRVEAVAQRVEAAVRNQMVTKTLGGVVKSMNVALKAMDLEKVLTLMDSFEKQSENLDIQASVMEKSMNNTTAVTIPEDKVVALLSKIADENGLEYKTTLPVPGSNIVGLNSQVQQPSSQELDKLQNFLSKYDD